MSFDTKEDAYHAGYADGLSDSMEEKHRLKMERHGLKGEIQELKEELAAERDLGMKLAAKLLHLGEDITACLKTQ